MNPTRWIANSLSTWMTTGTTLIVLATVLTLVLMTQRLVQHSVVVTSNIVLDEVEKSLVSSITETNESIARGLGNNLEQKLSAIQEILFTLSLSPDIRSGPGDTAHSFIEARLYAEHSLISLSLTNVDGIDNTFANYATKS
jgi:hypothetical protein